MATVEYDNIQLNLTSAFNDKGAEEAIDNLDAIGKGLKELDSSSVKEATQDFRDFAEAVGEANNASLNVLDAIDEQRRAKDMEFARRWNEKGTSLDSSSNKRNMDFYKSVVADIQAQNARTAEQKAQTEAITNEWNEIGQAIDADISKTFSFRNAIAVTYDKLMDTLGIYKQTPPTVEEIMEKMGDVADKTSQVGKEAKKSLSPLEKLAKRLKNLLVYRALRFVISGMANAVKEGFKNLEDWDRNIGMTGFADSMDRARESLTVLKNSLAVIAAPGLEWLIGILQRVAQFAMTAANAISRFFAILGGKSSYRAVKWADAVADSQASAAGSAKKATQEFKKQLMAFDEINNLTAPSDSGSGGGGGGGSASSANEMFEERSVGELGDWGKFLQKIGEAWREMSERIRTANDATSRHLNSIKDVVKAWKDFFTDPKTNFSKWSEDFASSVETIKGNIKDFIQGFKEARENGAGYFEAIQAGLDNIGKSKVPQQLANNFADTLNATEAKFKNLDGSTAVGFAHMKENSILVSDNMRLKLGGAFNQIQTDGEKAFNGIDSTIQTKAINPVGALSGALNSVFGRTYSLTLQTNEVVNRTVHVNEIYNQIQGKGYMYNAKYASGGFPTQGQMFIAREAGPELVGTIGGQTAVVNNSDIVASVSQGVAQAVASVLGGGQQVNVTLEGDAKNLFKVVQREGRAYSARTGQPALA